VRCIANPGNADTNGYSDRYRRTVGDTMCGDSLERELRWGDRARVARRVGGSQCRRDSATVGDHDHDA
jgi:hypothetical protein